MTLRSVQEIYGYHIQATDGEIGTVQEFLFDDEHWAIRYLVVETGDWLHGRQVLISAAALGTAEWRDSILNVKLTRQQIKNSPDIDTDKPVSRQHELVLANYYGYSPYWGGTGIWGMGMYPAGLWAVNTLGMPEEQVAPNTASAIVGAAIQHEEAQAQQGDPHLRSTREVKGYRIQTLDDHIGHVDDVIVDEETWAINAIVVDTRNWLPGKHVLIEPRWISTISWDEHAIHVNLRTEQVKNSPEYNPAQTLNREDVERLHAHYDQPVDKIEEVHR